MSQSLEYGPIDKPIPVDDVSTSYVRISAGAGQVFPKTLTYDTALIVGRSTPITQCGLTSRTVQPMSSHALTSTRWLLNCWVSLKTP